MGKNIRRKRSAKLVAFILCAAVILSLCVGLSGCHFHTRQWESHGLKHRYVCSCGDYILEGDHVYDEGKITKEPTQESDGERTYTCKECLHEKKETVKFEGLSEQQWYASMSNSRFKNFSYRETATIYTYNSSVKTVTEYMITEERGWARISVGKIDESEYAQGAELKEAIDSLVFSIQQIADYEAYKYNRDTKTYTSHRPVYVKAINSKVYAEITFTDGLLSKISYSGSFSVNGTTASVKGTVEIYDYGTTYLNRS